ncbi:hypothetical protein HYV50_05870 [Candidatus Pacearchaeota archaeon]|nr:hypothetical protein [Candidatus Pacearchaeota archaeon]
MNHTATKTKIALMVFLILIYLPLLSALELELNSPAEAEINKEFSVSISANSDSDKYDIKIFVHNSEDGSVNRGEYISEIYNPSNDKWQDSWNYLPALFPEQTQYKIRVTESPGEREICARLRKEGTSATSTKCGQITITSSENNNNNDENENNSEDNEDEESDNNENPQPQNQMSANGNSNENNDEDENNNDNPSSSRSSTSSSQSSPTINSLSYVTSSEDEKIYLKPKSKTIKENTANENYFSTKKDKFILWITLGFTFVLVIVVILLAFRKL